LRQNPVRGSGPQGLRRPRFSFFLFTCQTSRNPRVPSPRTGERSKPPASDHDRKLFHTGSVRSFEGAPSRRNADGAPLWRYIGFCRRGCQHIMSEKYHCGSAKTNVSGIPWRWRRREPGSTGRPAQPPETMGASPLRRTGATFLGRSLTLWWEVSVRGVSRRRHTIRDDAAVPDIAEDERARSVDGPRGRRHRCRRPSQGPFGRV
jgi:hypothetical protein